MAELKGRPDPRVAKHRDSDSANILIAPDCINTGLLGRAIVNRPPNEDALRGMA